MTRRAVLRPRPAVLAVVGAVLLALVGASLAQASAVTITTRLKPFSTSQSRCTSQTVAVTNAVTATTTSSVVVSNVDTTGCAGRPIVVTVYDPTVTTWPAASRLVASGTVSAATATLTAASGNFTPTAGLTVHVTIGGWQVPATWTRTTPPGPVNTCEVRNADGSLDASKPCTVLGPPAVDVWGATGLRLGNYRTTFSAPTITNTQYVAYTVTLIGMPANWSWTNAILTGTNNGNAVSSSCDALPVVTGRLGANKGATPEFYVTLLEYGPGWVSAICQR